MVLTRSSQIQTRNQKRSKAKNAELTPSMTKRSVGTRKKKEQASSYLSLSKTSRAKLTKLSNDRMAKASQLKKLKSSLRRKSTNLGSFVIGTSDEALKAEVKDETDSDGDREKVGNVSPDGAFSIKNEMISDEPAEEVEGVVQNVSSEELGVMRDLLRNYIRMVAIGEDKFDICYNPLMAVLRELTSDQFKELVEILRDTDFMVKNADVTPLQNNDKPTIAFNCKVVHKNNIFKEEKRVLVKATFIKGSHGLREMLKKNPDCLDSVPEDSEEAPQKEKKKRRKPRRDPHLSEDAHKKSFPYRPKRKVTDFDRPTILKRTQGAVKEPLPKMGAQEERQPPRMFNLDNTGKLIVEKKLPTYSRSKETTPATALSASERLKLRKEAAARASEKKVILKKLLLDVDLDAGQELPLQRRPPAPGLFPSIGCLPLASAVPTIIAAPKEQFR